MTFGFLITSQTREELHAAIPILRVAVYGPLAGFSESYKDIVYSRNSLELPPRLAYQQGFENKRVKIQGKESGDVLLVPFPCWTFEDSNMKEEMMNLESLSGSPVLKIYANGSLEDTLTDKMIEGMAKAYLLKGTNVFGFGGYTSVVIMPKAMRGLNQFVNSKIARKLEEFATELKNDSEFFEYHLTEKEKQEGLLDRIAEITEFDVNTYNTSGSYLTSWYSFKGLEEIAQRNHIDLENTPIAIYGFGAVSRGITELILEKYSRSDIHIVRRNSSRLKRDIKELGEKHIYARISGSVNENSEYNLKGRKITIVATSMLHPFLKSEDIDDGAIVLDDGRPKSISDEQIELLKQKGGKYYTLGLVKSKLDSSGNPLISHGLGRRIMKVAQLKENQHLACFAETLTLDKMLRDGADSSVLERYASLRVNLEHMGDIVKAADEIFEVDV